MKKNKNYLVGFSFILLFLGCQKHAENESVDSQAVELLNVLPEDFKTPETVWNLILSSGKAEPSSKANQKTESSNEAQKTDDHAGAVSESIPPLVDSSKLDLESIVFSALDVVLEEKNPGILKSPRIQISYPRGGGKLDLRQYLTGEIGTFFIRFQPIHIDKADRQFTLFWSRAKKRRIDGEVYGSGCNKVLRMNSDWETLQSSRGFEVNTHRDRHLSVIGGRFFFISNKGSEYYLSQIYILDSERKDLFCEDEGSEL